MWDFFACEGPRTAENAQNQTAVFADNFAVLSEIESFCEHEDGQYS